MSTAHSPLSVAPMMAWTDRHCRYFHRLLAPHALLYTEMVTAQALLHGDVPRHLDFTAAEKPVILQLGGSEPDDLAVAAALGEKWGYQGINLNCGCPSERVQRGAFGACLMQEPELVANCVRAMREAVDVPVTVKHRIGVDRIEDYAFVRGFVKTVAAAGCDTFIVHARNAWLSGLSPKENREVPPLRYEFVHRLKDEFPHLRFILNGGLSDIDAALSELQDLDGLMLGRIAYQQPYLLTLFEARMFGTPIPTRASIVRAMTDYIGAYLEREEGAQVRHVVRHMLGLFHGLPAARAWRRTLSDATLLEGATEDLLQTALKAMDQAAREGRAQSIFPGFIKPKGSSAALI